MSMLNVTVQIEVVGGTDHFGTCQVNEYIRVKSVIKWIIEDLEMEADPADYMLTIANHNKDKNMNEIKFEEGCHLEIKKIPKKLIVSKLKVEEEAKCH